MSSTITILHFNDVYNVESRTTEPVGGASRFAHAIKSFSSLNPLVLFSGDIFSPSLLSTFTKGEHMSHVLNEINTQCAVFGNHDFDYGLEVLAERVSETNFPWLMSNVIDKYTGRPLGDGVTTHVIEWDRKRIGLLGLVEEEWIDTMQLISADDLIFLNFVEIGQKLSAELKQQGCDYVIALTHMRTRNDRKLAESDSDIDLILGGHDHIYETLKVNNKYIIKSGTDFRQFSKITINFHNSCTINIEEINITSSIPEDKNINELLQKYEGVIASKMNEILGTFDVQLEGRFPLIRTEETNLGNWVADILLAATGADLVIINSGTFRSDQIHPPGDLTLGDLMRIIPQLAPTIVIKISGEKIWKALENGVSKYPILEGRFPQVAGISFAFDPDAPPGERIDPLLIRIGGKYLVKHQDYKLATKCFLQLGNDGYTMLPDCEILISAEVCPELCLSVQNHCYAVGRRLFKSKFFSKLGGSGSTNLNSHLNDDCHYEGELSLSKVNVPCDPDHFKSVPRLIIPPKENRIIKITSSEAREKLYQERDRLGPEK